MALFSRKVKARSLPNLETLEELIASGMPVLIDFMQFGCPACKAMDGTIDDLADEFDGSAHVVRINVQKVPGAAQAFKVKGTPTFLMFARSRRAAKRAKRTGEPQEDRMTRQFHAVGIVDKQQLRRLLLSNGAKSRYGKTR